jgi:hypothetical protein
MGATLDGLAEGTCAVFEAKFMLPWSFSEEVAAAKYMPQLQHKHVGRKRQDGGANATRIIGPSPPQTHASCTGGDQPTLTICGSLSPAQWAAR